MSRRSSRSRCGPQGHADSVLQSTDRQDIRPAPPRDEITDRLPADTTRSRQRIPPDHLGRLAHEGVEALSHHLNGSCRSTEHFVATDTATDLGFQPVVRIGNVVPWPRCSRSSASHEHALLEITIETDDKGRLIGHWSWRPGWGIDMDDGVLRYRPRMVSHDTWERIGPAVRTLALLTKTVGAPKRTSDLMGPLVRLAAWAEEQGIPLDAAELSAPPTVLRYILTTEGLASVSRRSQKSTLNRMVEAVRFNKYGEHPPVQLSAKPSPSRPYEAAEEATWLVWAQSLTTPLQRRNALILLTLGRGCGVAAEDLAHMSGRHVQRGPSGRAIVTIPGKPGDERARQRQVVCRYRYERLLLEVTASISTDEWLFRPDWGERDSRHLVTGWTEDFPLVTGRDRSEQIQLQRLRNGWIVELLDCRIPLTVILAAAGLKTLHSVSRLLPFVEAVSRDEAADHLRGRPPEPPTPKATRRAA